MNMQSSQQLETSLEAGGVYRREDAAVYSKAVDRDLQILVEEGLLQKVAAGIYYKPKESRYGVLPPDANKLVRAFLRDDHFLLFTRSDYNSLGLGLTQLYNEHVVYNYKRYCRTVLAGQQFDFRRPPRGFPSHLSREYLLVDLVNNLNLIAEDSGAVEDAIKRKLHLFDADQLQRLAVQYGKVSTRRFFEGLKN